MNKCKDCGKIYSKREYNNLNPELCLACSDIKIMMEYDDHINRMAKTNPIKFKKLYGNTHE